jgi:hypothetical protein
VTCAIKEAKFFARRCPLGEAMTVRGICHFAVCLVKSKVAIGSKEARQCEVESQPVDDAHTHWCTSTALLL